MAIGPITTSRFGGNDAWMGSRHAVAEAHPGTLNAEAFASAAGVEGGIVPSGYPLVDNGDGTYGPYTGSGTLAGFSIDDRDINHGDELTAVMWHGRIKVDHLPIEFTPPTGTAFVFEPAASTDEGA